MLKVFPRVKINSSHTSVRAVTNTKENTVNTFFSIFLFFIFVHPIEKKNKNSGEHERKGHTS